VNKELEQFIKDNKQYSWRPRPPAPANIWTSDWPWVPYDKDIDPVSIQLELDSIDDLFIEHRSDDTIYNYAHSGWSSIVLHGLGSDQTESYEQYGFTNEPAYHWTDICSKIPYIYNITKSFHFNNYKRVRIMKLAPGGYIMPHVDGQGRVFGPFNFALTQPEECEFIFEGRGVVPFRQGRGFMLDLGLRHCVYNNSDTTRYHLIIHANPLPPMIDGVVQTIKKMSYEHNN
jgi:hypothetical protein